MLRPARPTARPARRRRPGASSSPTGGAAPRRASQRSDSGRVRRIAVTSSAGSPERMNAARQAELARDRLEQEGVEDEVVEIEEPPGPGERQDAVVERGRAIVLAEQHRGREATRGAHTSTRGAPPV